MSGVLCHGEHGGSINIGISVENTVEVAGLRRKGDAGVQGIRSDSQAHVGKRITTATKNGSGCVPLNGVNEGWLLAKL